MTDDTTLRSDRLVVTWLNGGKNYAVRVYALSEDGTPYNVPLAVHTFDPASVTGRGKLLAEMPPEYRDEATPLLRKLGERAAAHPKPTPAPAEEKTRQGHVVSFEDPKPWPAPVSTAGLLETLTRLAARFLYLPDGAALKLALWVLLAWAHDAFAISPLLALTSPKKRCGKTTVLEWLAGLVPRSLAVSNITVATLFRVVEFWRPTCLIDEADTFIDDRNELRGIINSGHNRALAFVPRCIEPDNEVRMFSTWAPKAIAKIGQLPETLADRSIAVEMDRRPPGHKLERFRRDRWSGDCADLRAQLTRWRDDHLEKLRALEPSVPPTLNDRAADNWRGLLAIAELAGEAWVKDAQTAATGDAETAEKQTIVDTLLMDIRATFGDRDRLSTADLLASLHRIPERPWNAWRRDAKSDAPGHPLDGMDLSRLLSRHRVSPKQVKIDGENLRGYLLEDFKKVFSSYLPPSEPATPATVVSDNDLQRCAPATANESGSGSPSSQVVGNHHGSTGSGFGPPCQGEMMLNGIIRHPDGSESMTDARIIEELERRRELAERQALEGGA